MKHFAWPPRVALFANAAEGGEGGVHVGKLFTGGQSTLACSHGGGVVAFGGGCANHVHVGGQHLEAQAGEAQPVVQMLHPLVSGFRPWFGDLLGCFGCFCRFKVAAKAADQLRGVDGRGDKIFVLGHQGFLPGTKNLAPVSGHGLGRRAVEADVKIGQQRVGVGIGVPQQLAAQVEIRQGGGQGAAAFSVDPQNACGAIGLHVAPEGLVAGVGQVAPDQHALVVVVDHEPALHDLCPLFHDDAVLTARG